MNQSIDASVGGFLLTSGSDLNKPAPLSYPAGLPAGIKVYTAWREALLRFVQVIKINPNAGSDMSMVRFGFRHRQYGGVGNYPGSVPTSHRPTYNTLTPVLFNMRVVNPNTLSSSAKQSVIQIGPSQYFVPPSGSIVSQQQWTNLS